jgi:hypothetical protein
VSPAIVRALAMKPLPCRTRSRRAARRMLREALGMLFEESSSLRFAWKLESSLLTRTPRGWGPSRRTPSSDSMGYRLPRNLFGSPPPAEDVTCSAAIVTSRESAFRRMRSVERRAQRGRLGRCRSGARRHRTGRVSRGRPPRREGGPGRYSRGTSVPSAGRIQCCAPCWSGSCATLACRSHAGRERSRGVVGERRRAGSPELRAGRDAAPSA